jgi:uncharacterized protein (TIGR03086 family)
MNGTLTANSDVELLRRAVNYTLSSVDAVRPDLLSRPTPCSEWDLQMLLEHANESIAALHEGLDSGRVAMFPTMAYDIAADPVSDFRARVTRLVDEWTASDPADRVAIADRVIPLSLAAGVAAVEIAVHGWDIAQASGHTRPIPADLAEDLLAISALLLSDGNRYPLFGPPLRPRVPASRSDELLAFLGRPASVTLKPGPNRTDTRS